MFNKSLVCLVIGCCAGVSDRRQSWASNLALGLDRESAGLRVVGRSLGERYRRRECNSAGQRAGGVRAWCFDGVFSWGFYGWNENRGLDCGILDWKAFLQRDKGESGGIAFSLSVAYRRTGSKVGLRSGIPKIEGESIWFVPQNCINHQTAWNVWMRKLRKGMVASGIVVWLKMEYGI